MAAEAALTAHEVVFAHAVNSLAKWAEVADSDCGVTFLEVDVITSKDGAPVLGHDPGQAWDMSLEDALAKLPASLSMGLKLDFKTAAALQGSVSALQKGWRGGLAFNFREKLCDALLLNADVLPATAPCKFFPKHLEVSHTHEALESHIECVVKCMAEGLAAVPTAALSLGWCTAEEGGSYTQEHVDNMTNVIARIREAVDDSTPVTLAVRGTWVRSSWPVLQPMLAADGALSLTVWSNCDLKAADIQWMHETLPSSTLYDHPGQPQ